MVSLGDSTLRETDTRSTRPSTAMAFTTNEGTDDEAKEDDQPY
jgi:hypothetical protein